LLAIDLYYDTISNKEFLFLLKFIILLK